MFWKIVKENINLKLIAVLFCLQISIIFLIIVYGIFYTIQEFAWGIYELVLFLWIMIIVKLLHQKFHQKQIIERLKLNNFNESHLKNYIYLISFVFGLLIIASYLLWAYLYSTYWENNLNIAGTYIGPIIWSKVCWKSFILFQMGELILIIFFAFAVNSLFLQKNGWYFIITIIIFTYMMFNGNLGAGAKGNPIAMNYTIGTDSYPMWKDRANPIIITMNFIICSWTNLGMWYQNVLRNFDPNRTFHFLDNTYIGLSNDLGGFLANTYWIPYLFIFLYLSAIIKPKLFFKD